MKKRIDTNTDYLRATHLLRNKINNPYDLMKIWAAFGPCIENHPDIEKIQK